MVWPLWCGHYGVHAMVCTIRCRDSMVLAFYGVVQCGVKRLLKKFMQYGYLVINKLYELICK